MCGLDVRSIGEEHARDVTAGHLAPILGATLRDEGAQVLATDAAPDLRKGQVPDSVGRGQKSARSQVRAHRSEKSAALREQADDLELRVLARARVRPDSPQERTEKAPPRTVDATEKVSGHGLRLARAARKLCVRRLGVRGEPEVALHRAEQVRG